MPGKKRKASLLTETDKLKKKLRWKRCHSGAHIYFDEFKARAEYCCHPDFKRVENTQKPPEGAINPEQQNGLWSWWEKK